MWLPGILLSLRLWAQSEGMLGVDTPLLQQHLGMLLPQRLLSPLLRAQLLLVRRHRPRPLGLLLPHHLIVRLPLLSRRLRQLRRSVGLRRGQSVGLRPLRRRHRLRGLLGMFARGGLVRGPRRRQLLPVLLGRRD